MLSVTLKVSTRRFSAPITLIRLCVRLESFQELMISPRL